MTTGELAQQGAQRGRRVHPGEQPVHPTGPDHVQVVDAVRIGQQAADDRCQLGGRVRRTRLHQLAGEPHMLIQQLRQAGLLGQFQHRDQSSARHQIHIIEHGDTAVPPMRQFHRKCPSDPALMRSSANPSLQVKGHFRHFTRRHQASRSADPGLVPGAPAGRPFRAENGGPVAC
jgi:hypothetical protein